MLIPFVSPAGVWGGCSGIRAAQQKKSLRHQLIECVHLTDVLSVVLPCAGLFREGLHHESPRGRRQDWPTQRAHV